MSLKPFARSSTPSRRVTPTAPQNNPDVDSGSQWLRGRRRPFVMVLKDVARTLDTVDLGLLVKLQVAADGQIRTNLKDIASAKSYWAPGAANRRNGRDLHTRAFDSLVRLGYVVPVKYAVPRETGGGVTWATANLVYDDPVTADELRDIAKRFAHAIVDPRAAERFAEPAGRPESRDPVPRGTDNPDVKPQVSPSPGIPDPGNPGLGSPGTRGPGTLKETGEKDGSLVGFTGPLTSRPVENKTGDNPAVDNGAKRTAASPPRPTATLERPDEPTRPPAARQDRDVPAPRSTRPATAVSPPAAARQDWALACGAAAPLVTEICPRHDGRGGLNPATGEPWCPSCRRLAAAGQRW